MLSYSSALLRKGSGSGSGDQQSQSQSTPQSSLHRSRSRSPSASPGYGRPSASASASSMAQPLPTIPSASNLAFNADSQMQAGDMTASSSPRSFTLSSSVSIPLPLRSSSNSGRPLPDPIGSGSPREARLWGERGATPVNSNNNAFSSSFPSSGGIWGNTDSPSQGQQQQGVTGNMNMAVGTPPVRSSLSRHLSLSGRQPGSNTSQSPTGHNSSRGADWPDSPFGSNAALEVREGRSRSRFGASVGPGGLQPGAAGGSGLESALHRSLSIASERPGKYDASGGIAISNMSPFVRDVGQLPQPTGAAGAAQGLHMKTPHFPQPNQPYSASFTTNSDFFPHGRQAAGASGRGGANTFFGGFNPHTGGSSPGDFNMSLGRHQQKRRDSFWGTTERPLHESDEDADSDEEDYAPPTRSGATSRRHSVAAFGSGTGLSALSGLKMTSPPARTQIGFHLPSEAHAHAAGHSRSASMSATSPSAALISGSSALDDEDLLATNLSNALQLNLDAQAARQQQRSSPNSSLAGAHAASLPVQIPGQLAQPATQSAAHSYAPGQHLSSPYRAPQAALYGSPPSMPGVGARRPSTSGDPYSPSASAARYLATAQNVQPPPLQPQQHQGGTSSLPSANLPTSLWPPPGVNVFSQGSPHFRSGVLPPPEALAGYGSGSDDMRGSSPLGQRDPSPQYGGASHSQQQQMQMQRGAMPPFAGFAGRQNHMNAGLPPPMVSPMNAHAHPYYVAPIAPQPSLNELGRGVPLHALPSGGPLYIVEFKAGRTDLFYVDDAAQLSLAKGDLVVVEADRGKDLGKILTSCTLDEVRDFQMHQVESALGQLAAGAGGSATIGGVGTLPQQQGGAPPSAATIARMTKEIHPKRIYGRASPTDVALLAIKAQDEAKALGVCRAKVAQHQLPMEVTDAEFQFDRRRLTFFYIADRRIDFRNLVKDLFRLYKTRIWLVASGSF